MRHVARGEWGPARDEIRRYLRLHPRDVDARVMLAEAFGRDDALNAETAARNAIAQLLYVPDESALGAKARTQEGRLRFLIFNQPAQAERLFRRAIELDARNYDAHYMLWKLLELTGRVHLTEDVFWRVYDLSPENEQHLRLREWFLSEFSPRSETAPFDEKMGFLEESEKATVLVDYKRLTQFQDAEPESPVFGTAIARLYWREGLRDRAREVLDEVETLETAYDDAYYVATRVGLLLDFGEFQEAGACFNRWPEPKTGFEYWKWKAILLDEMGHDDNAALVALDEALSVWPGCMDWQLMVRKAHCLNRLGLRREAENVRRIADRFGQLMRPDRIVQLRKVLMTMDDSAGIRSVVDFYQGLGRVREADEWKRQYARLSAASPGEPKTAEH